MKNISIFFLLALFSTPSLGLCQTISLFDEEPAVETAVNNADTTDDATPKAEGPAVSETTAAEEPQKEETTDSQSSETDYLDNYIDDVETEKKAQNTARDLLNQKPQLLTIRQNDQKSLEQLKERTKQIKEKLAPFATNTDSTDKPQEKTETIKMRRQKIKDSLQPAPLGLYWAATEAELKELGFNLLPAERKDYKNVFQVTNTQQKNNTFQQIIAIFGEQDKLWCIYAQSHLLDDNARAEKVLALYRRYYDALAKKYGNAQEHFEPYTYEEKIIEGEKEQKQTKTIQKQNPIGGADFLKELQEGKAVLYATFKNDKIGITLGVSVDGDGKSYISIDYKDFALMQSEKQTALDNTIDDL